LITEKKEKNELMTKYHDNPLLGGHCGQKRLLKKLKSAYRWRNMSRDVANYVRKCHKCKINKAKIKHREPMIITPTPQQAFDIVCIDTIGPFQKSNRGYSYAVTIQCELTKYIVIIPILNKEAVTVAKAIVGHFILIYGPMKEIRTDMGLEYKNELISNISKLLSIKHSISTAYHSQTIGGCERNHRVFNEYVRMYINESLTDWDTWTAYYGFCYNTTPSSYHNYTPFELVFGRNVNIPGTLMGSSIDPLYNLDAYDQEVRYRLQVAHKRAKEQLEKTKRERKVEYDVGTDELILQHGDLVTLTNENRSVCLSVVNKGILFS
jgi:transposase InsO family protein